VSLDFLCCSVPRMNGPERAPAPGAATSRFFPRRSGMLADRWCASVTSALALRTKTAAANRDFGKRGGGAENSRLDGFEDQNRAVCFFLPWPAQAASVAGLGFRAFMFMNYDTKF